MDGLKALLKLQMCWWYFDWIFNGNDIWFTYYHPLWDVWMYWDDICTFEIVMVAIAQ